MQTLYLSRRNLLTLLHKLDRSSSGEQSFCTIIKADTVHQKYPSSDVIRVTALEDSDYYTDRSPGPMHPADEPKRRLIPECAKCFDEEGSYACIRYAHQKRKA